MIVGVFYPHIQRFTEKVRKLHAPHVTSGLGILSEGHHFLFVKAQEGVGFYPVPLVPDIVPVVEAVDVNKEIVCRCQPLEYLDGIVVHLLTEAIQ